MIKLKEWVEEYWPLILAAVVMGPIGLLLLVNAVGPRECGDWVAVEEIGACVAAGGGCHPIETRCRVRLSDETRLSVVGPVLVGDHYRACKAYTGSQMYVEHKDGAR